MAYLKMVNCLEARLLAIYNGIGELLPTSSNNYGAFSIQPKLSKISEQREMVQKSPGKDAEFPKCEPFNRKF